MNTATLLVELLAEELPPKALKKLGEAFANGLASGLRGAGFLTDTSEVTGFATPRRLAVSITHVRAVAPDKPFKEKLLPLSLAFDSTGNPTPALIGRLKAKQLSHIDPKSLLREPDGKAESLYYAGIAKGVPLANALQAALDDVLAKLPIPKVMSYAAPGSYYNDVKFVRPAHKLVALYGADVVPIRALDLDAGRVTGGHRFLSRGDIEIATADAYAPTLEAEGKVILSFAARRAKIVVGLEGAAGAATPIMPDALLDEVTALVEWPVVYQGTFDAAFLQVPQECLILTMQLNQRYFALRDDAGKLVNRFLLVSNIETRDPSAIISGNERVLRARLADAKFFFDQDRRQTLASRLPGLAAVIYHNKLGSQYARVERIAGISIDLAQRLGADSGKVERAARLCKADLQTEMVREFPELQGIMGDYYARHDGEAMEVATAISQHYLPKFSGDALPESLIGSCVAIADKVDFLVALFGADERPSGDRDPYALRRQALGLIRILIEKHLPVDLECCIDLGIAWFESTKPQEAWAKVIAEQMQRDGRSGAVAYSGLVFTPQARGELLGFLYERLRGFLREHGYTANQIEAVLAHRPCRIDLVLELLSAVRLFEALPEAAALAAANKRIVNILRKSGAEAATAVDRGRLADGAEHDLYLAFQKLTPQVEGDVNDGNFAGALRALATAKPVVDRYFEDVMVMADDPAIRANRLALLRSVAATMNRVADISKLAQ